MSTGFISALNFSNPTSSIITPKEEFKNEEEGGVAPRNDSSTGEF